MKLTAGPAYDGRSAADMVASLGDDDVLLANRAYDSDALRTDMTAFGAIDWFVERLSDGPATIYDQGSAMDEA